jgi:hypothetical protein
LYKVAWDGQFMEPREQLSVASISVKDINQLLTPWLVSYGNDPIVIHAGTTLEDFIKKIELGDGTVYLERFIARARHVEPAGRDAGDTELGAEDVVDDVVVRDVELHRVAAARPPVGVQREVEHLAAFLHVAVDYKKKIGFTGQFYIEPKPREPSTHQYDSDAAACLNFLREHGLMDHFKLNLETNHATLAGHSMWHEMEVAVAANALGSVDANTGDELIGWDTDQFPTDIYLTTQMMLVMLKSGGFTTGGMNFDAKVRRESFEPVDLFHAHIGGMDAFARGLKIAAAILEDGRLESFKKTRYSTFDSGIGAKIEARATSFDELEAYTLENGEPLIASGRQEMLENLINEFI